MKVAISLLSHPSFFYVFVSPTSSLAFVRQTFTISF